MNIGFDASRAFNKNRTGTENYSYQLLYHLSKLDHTNNYYIYLRPEKSDEIRKSVIQKISDPETDILKHRDTGLSDLSDLSVWPSNFKFTTIPYPRLWTQVGLAKQTFKDKLDVLFIPSHTLPLIRKPSLKTVVTVHDLGAEYLPKTHQLKQRAYLKLMTDVQLKSATHLIAVSNATKDDLIKKVHIKPNKITVVYEGYDKDKFQITRNKIQTIQTIKQYNLIDQNYFLFVGTIQPRKNLERLITAFSLQLSAYKRSFQASLIRQKQKKSDDRRPTTDDLPKLVLAGSKGWLSDEIYELPKKLGIEEQVKFLGYVPDENLPALYNGAIALLFPSLFEGFGLPILEAMACECPVLTSNISSMPEIAGQSAILVDPYSEDEIAQGISRLFNDQKLRDKLQTLGIAQSKKFSWEKCAQETLEILTSVAR